jgi:hypothetical protein
MTNHPQDETYQETLCAIDALAELEKGWNSYGASPITPAAIARAKKFAGEVAISGRLWSPFVGPTPDGGVALIWEKGELCIDVDFSPETESEHMAHFCITSRDTVHVFAEGDLADAKAFLGVLENTNLWDRWKGEPGGD